MADHRPVDARYLYVLKDEPEVYYVAGEPTAGDMERVRQGSLAIIRLADLWHLAEDGIWRSPKIGALNTLYQPDAPGSPVNLPRDVLKIRAKKSP